MLNARGDACLSEVPVLGCKNLRERGVSPAMLFCPNLERFTATYHDDPRPHKGMILPSTPAEAKSMIAEQVQAGGH